LQYNDTKLDEFLGQQFSKPFELVIVIVVKVSFS